MLFYFGILFFPGNFSQENSVLPGLRNFTVNFPPADISCNRYKNSKQTSQGNNQNIKGTNN
jgi:hypothetical protein